MPREGITGPDVVGQRLLSLTPNWDFEPPLPLFGQREERKVNKISSMFSLKLNEYPILKTCPVLWCQVILTVFSLEIAFPPIELF